MKRATMSMLARGSLGLLAHAWLFACTPSDVPATQIIVTVAGETRVLERLRRVRASLYDGDAVGDAMAVQTHDFEVDPHTGAAGTGVRPPFSFGIMQGRANRLKLVIEGYEELDAEAKPVIEQKTMVTFADEQTLSVRVLLTQTCFALSHPCSGLAVTCWAEARACGPLRETLAVPVSPGALPVDAGVPVDPGRPAGCPVVDPCSPDYPCTSTATAGYVCLGQRAEWPAAIAGSKVAPAYDLSDPRILEDQVTGLVWQRERPPRYEGCTGFDPAPGGACTPDEGKRYCSQLRLAERTWRLPSKAELETLIDHRIGGPTVHRVAFPDTPHSFYWTGSLHPHGGAQGTGVPQAWAVSFLTGASTLLPANTWRLVRCVSGAPTGRILPEQRYSVNAAEDTMTDRATGLVWERTGSLPLNTLEEATARCRGLGDAWRVPDVKEVLTLLDPTRVDPALVPDLARPASQLTWATATRPDGTVDAWHVDVSLGATYPRRLADITQGTGDEQQLSSHVRCVR